jgi:hypothetical protein
VWEDWRHRYAATVGYETILVVGRNRSAGDRRGDGIRHNRHQQSQLGCRHQLERHKDGRGDCCKWAELQLLLQRQNKLCRVRMHRGWKSQPTFPDRDASPNLLRPEPTVRQRLLRPPSPATIRLEMAVSVLGAPTARRGLCGLGRCEATPGLSFGIDLIAPDVRSISAGALSRPGARPFGKTWPAWDSACRARFGCR